MGGEGRCGDADGTRNAATSSGDSSILKSPGLTCGNCGLEELVRPRSWSNSLLRQRAIEGNSRICPGNAYGHQELLPESRVARVRPFDDADDALLLVLFPTGVAAAAFDLGLDVVRVLF